MSWFEEWFDHPLYEKLYADRNEEEAEQLIGFLEQYIPLDRYPKILDLGCGRGRHSLALGRKGYRVTGVDLSERAIDKAEQARSQEGLENVTFQVGDMRRTMEGTFDAVVNLFTSFGYFKEDEENIRVLRNINDMLVERGVLVLDYMNAVRVARDLTPYEQGQLSDMEQGRLSDMAYTIRRYIDGDAIYKKMKFERPDTGDQQVFQERVKLYDRKWFEESLKKSGFTIERFFGDYHGRRFDSQASPRLITFGRKSD